MKVTLTLEAAQHFNKMLKSNPGHLGIRLGVKDSGCAQYSYVVDFCDEKLDNDVLISEHNVDLYINQDIGNLLDGLIIDYVAVGISKMLEFKNPNAVSECGCGESFSIKK